MHMHLEASFHAPGGLLRPFVWGGSYKDTDSGYHFQLWVQVADELVREVLNPKIDPHTGVQEQVRFRLDLMEAPQLSVIRYLHLCDLPRIKTCTPSHWRLFAPL